MLAGLEDWQGHFQIVQTPPVDQGVEGLELEGLKDLIGLLDKESTGLIDPIDPIGMAFCTPKHDFWLY
jgi:hypothetical protein